MTNLTTLDQGGPPEARSTDIATVEARESQIIQGMIIVAHRFPRDETRAFASIMRTCERVTFAEVATYAFPRGGQTVSGPSIRMAEAIKQAWGNMRSGWREVERMPGGSKCAAYAWDMQTNAYEDVEFYVPHVRDTKKGPKQLTDERDIYEMNANNSKRRERACILAIIPGDIVEAAQERCFRTLESGTKLAEAIPKMIKAFDEYGVSVEQIQARFRRVIGSIGHTEYRQLRQIYQSLKDGMSKPEDWFEPLHDPEKIKRETEAGANPEPPPAPKNDAPASAPKPPAGDAEAKAKAIAAFTKAQTALKQRGGDIEKVLNRSVADIMKSDVKVIVAATDILEKWSPAK